MTSESILKYWQNRWDKNDTKWHLKDINPTLAKHKDKLLAVKKNAHILFPLCGKCIDMKWMYDQGCHVTGIECYETVVREFFEEQNLEFETYAVDKTKVYHTPDKRLRLICADLFSINKELCGNVDAIWDRGGLVAIEKELRKRYGALMLSLLATDFRYILCAFHYNDWYFSAEPRNLPVEVIRELYDGYCQIEVIDEMDRTVNFGQSFDCSPVIEKVYLLSPK